MLVGKGNLWGERNYWGNECLQKSVYRAECDLASWWCYSGKSVTVHCIFFMWSLHTLSILLVFSGFCRSTWGGGRAHCENRRDAGWKLLTHHRDSSSFSSQTMTHHRFCTTDATVVAHNYMWDTFSPKLTAKLFPAHSVDTHWPLQSIPFDLSRSYT